MDVKEFLRITKKKILLAAMLFLVVPLPYFSPALCNVMGGGYKCPDYLGFYPGVLVLLGVIFSPLIGLGMLAYSFYLVLPGLFVEYLIACYFASWPYAQFKKRLGELGPTPAKILLLAVLLLVLPLPMQTSCANVGISQTGTCSETIYFLSGAQFLLAAGRVPGMAMEFLIPPAFLKLAFIAAEYLISCAIVSVYNGSKETFWKKCVIALALGVAFTVVTSLPVQSGLISMCTSIVRYGFPFQWIESTCTTNTGMLCAGNSWAGCTYKYDFPMLLGGAVVWAVAAGALTEAYCRLSGRLRHN